MLTFLDTSMWISGWMGIWFLALLFCGIALFAVDARGRIVGRICLIPVMMLSYYSFQCITYINEDDFAIEETLAGVAAFARAPLFLILGMSVLVTLLEGHLLADHIQKKKRNLGRTSIKEAVDSLPAGICCFEENGRIILKNNVMEEICRLLTGEALLNGGDFAQVVQREARYIEKRPILLLPDQTFAMEEHEIVSEDRSLRVLTASDITEEYRKTQELSDKRKKVTQLNEKLQTYNREIAAIITKKEILNAKIKVHDVLGGALLTAKRYITAGASKEQEEEILSELTRSVDYLLSETGDGSRDSYQMIFETAQKLGAFILVSGILPEDPVRKKIVSTAMHECLTNTIRHADGDTLYVTLENIGKTLLVTITDNGKNTIRTMNERGGLASLCSLVEDSSGEMSVSSEKGFKLTIRLPEEKTEDAI